MEEKLLSDKDTIKIGIKKVFFTIATQFIILILSVITGFILPQKMGPENFGYWQIYLFYLAYINVFGLGFNDGLALFYGGYEYNELPFKKIRSAMKIFYSYLIIITIIGWFLTFIVDDKIYQNIYKVLVLNIPITCIQCVVLTTFLAVNKTEIYNIINIVLKVLSVMFYLALLFSNVTNSIKIMYADLLARTIITVICIILGRTFLFGHSESIKCGLAELKEKSLSGFKITISLIASMFIPVLGRVIIERNECIRVYGIYSFAMSLLTIIMTFTTTAGTVIFPLLKKLRSSDLPGYYSKFQFVCDGLISIALFAYIPLILIIQMIMTKYIAALDYLYILLAMCFPLGRMQLLITPYYKAYRLEKEFLISNLVGIGFMAGFTLLSYSVFNSVTAVAICTTVILTIWSCVTEYYLNKKINCVIDKSNIIIELIIMIMFVVAGYFKNPLIFIAIYLPTVLLFFVVNKDKTKVAIKQLRYRKDSINCEDV